MTFWIIPTKRKFNTYCPKFSVCLVCIESFGKRLISRSGILHLCGILANRSYCLKTFGHNLSEIIPTPPLWPLTTKLHCWNVRFSVYSHFNADFDLQPRQRGVPRQVRQRVGEVRGDGGQLRHGRGQHQRGHQVTCHTCQSRMSCLITTLCPGSAPSATRSSGTGTRASSSSRARGRSG